MLNLALLFEAVFSSRAPLNRKTIASPPPVFSRPWGALISACFSLSLGVLVTGLCFGVRTPWRSHASTLTFSYLTAECCLQAVVSSCSRLVRQIGREVLDAAGRAVRVGATTDEIDRVVRTYTTCYCLLCAD